jgi:hypothetical protein
MCVVTGKNLKRPVKGLVTLFAGTHTWAEGFVVYLMLIHLNVTIRHYNLRCLTVSSGICRPAEL